MHQGQLGLHQPANQHFGGVANPLQFMKNVSAVGVSPPTAAHTLLCNCIDQRRHRTAAADQYYSMYSDKVQGVVWRLHVAIVRACRSSADAMVRMK